MSKLETDVAVVGYGPVGACAANLLGGYGIRTLVVEPEKDVYQRARAVTVNDWTMRIFQGMGLADAAAADMDTNDALSWKTYGGKTVFRLATPESQLGHASSYMIYQPAMEAALRKGVDRYPGMVEVLFGRAATELRQDGDSVTLTLDDGQTVRAKYVLACDGGSSRMRTAIGSRLQGTTHEVTWIVIDAEVKRYWPGANDLVFWSDPDRPVVDIPLALGNHRWELPLGDDEQRSDFDTEDSLWALLRPMGIGPEHVRLKQHAFYSHHVRHADHWRNGRVLLLGDAAHLMPPWAGQGMQSGIRDAHNVAWKIREVLAERLGDEILDTYQDERAPQVEAVTQLSLNLGQLIASRDPKFIRWRNTFGPLITRLPRIARKLLRSKPVQVKHGWVSGDTGPRSAVGKMLPQPPVWNAAGRRIVLDDALGDTFAILALDDEPETLLDVECAAQWRHLGARFVTVRSHAVGAKADSDVVDYTGALAEWLKRHRTAIVAVRPDRFIAASGERTLDPPSTPLGDGARRLLAVPEGARQS